MAGCPGDNDAYCGSITECVGGDGCCPAGCSSTTDSDCYQAVEEPEDLRVALPADESVHEEPMEWWYWTGHLRAEDGRWFGFELVFFLGRNTGIWRRTAHHAITDVDGSSFHHVSTGAVGRPEEVEGVYRTRLCRADAVLRLKRNIEMSIRLVVGTSWSVCVVLATLLATSGCSKRNLNSGDGEVIMIDGKPVSLTTLYPDDANAIVIRPIGYVVNNKQRGPGKFGITGEDVSEIHLYPGMARFMKGLEDETSLLILWQFHKARPIRSVFARGWDGKRVGAFASRTPDRLTPIGVTEVELLKVRGTTLIVRNLDAFNGTPVLDIKVSITSLKRSSVGKAVSPAD